MLYALCFVLCSVFCSALCVVLFCVLCGVLCCFVCCMLCAVSCVHFSRNGGRCAPDFAEPMHTKPSQTRSPSRAEVGALNVCTCDNKRRANTMLRPPRAGGPLRAPSCRGQMPAQGRNVGGLNNACRRSDRPRRCRARRRRRLGSAFPSTLSLLMPMAVVVVVSTNCGVGIWVALGVAVRDVANISLHQPRLDVFLGRLDSLGAGLDSRPERAVRFSVMRCCTFAPTVTN